MGVCFCLCGGCGCLGCWVVVSCCLCLRAVSGVVGVVVWVVGVVVWGGGLPVWLGGAVASGGVGVGFDVGLRVFVLGGVGVPVSGSAPVGFSSAHVSGSGSASKPSSVVPECGGVRVCSVCACGVWCFVVFFGGGVVGGGCWCGWGEG